MIRFNNDYNLTAHPAVLEAINELGRSTYPGYGFDEVCDRGIAAVKKAVGRDDVDVHFFPGATQANFIVIKAALNSVQSIICADTGHINAHEAASVENTGHKIIGLPNTDGKITASQIKEEAQKYYDEGEREYLTEPGLVYISFATEDGTLYSLEELKAISAVCKEYNMVLFVDGARMGYGLGSSENDISLNDFATLTDVFYLGGTKCGAMFGEAVVVVNEKLKHRFKTYMKQNGAVLAKGWLLGIQFEALLKDGLYFDITRQADEYAMEIREAFRKKGIREKVVSPTNQQFIVLSDEQKAALSKDFIFEEMGECVRFCTSWGTTREETDALIKAIENL